MNTYLLLRAAHIIGVIVWLGTTTTMALLAAYGRRDRELLERLPALARWLGPRVVGPSSIGALLTGVLLAMNAHLGFGELWLVLALSAFAGAALVGVGIRLPLTLRRRKASAHGRIADVERADRLLLDGSMVELALLYFAVADMVLKPTTGTMGWLIGGATILVLTVLRLLINTPPTPTRLEGRPQ